MSKTWHLWVDWDGDGTYEADEGGRMFALQWERGRREPIGADGFRAQSPGRASVLLDNADGRYDPYASNSPLYPNVRPGVLCRITVEDGGSTYAVFAGRIDDIQPDDRRGVRVTRVDITDGIGVLHGVQVSVGLQSSLTVDTAIGLVLDETDWPWSRSLGAGVDTLGYWWASKVSALAAITELANAEVGYYAVLGDGTLLYRSRHAVTTSIGTLSGSDLHTGVRVLQPWDALYTVVSVSATPRALVSGVMAWSLTSAVQVLAGDSTVLWADLSYNNAPAPAQSVTAGSYTANSAEDGSGGDLTSDISVSVEGLGETAKITVTNSGTRDAWLTGLELTADMVVAQDTAAAERTSSLTSVYGVHTMRMALAWQQDPMVAEDLAGYLLGQVSTPRGYVRCGPSVGQPGGILWADLGDKITLSLPDVGIGDDYRLEWIRGRWRDRGGQVVDVDWMLAPSSEIDDTYWRFPTRIGESSRFAY